MLNTKTRLIFVNKIVFVIIAHQVFGHMIFSNIFEIVGKIDIVLKLEKSVLVPP